MYSSEQLNQKIDDHDRQIGSKRQWKRILYENQLFPDNFIDRKRFLDQLDVSTNNQHLTHTSVLHSASVIAQQLSVVAVFLAIYKYILVHETALFRLVSFDCVLLLVGHIFHRALDVNVLSQPSYSQFFRGIFLFGVCLRVAAPALQTLTSSFSSNTIHALAIAFSSLHLVFYDYNYIHDSEINSFSGTLSLNASMFTAVLLASRLENIEMVFSFMLLAVICFSFYPIVARLMYQRSIALHLAVTMFQWGIASGLLFSLDFVLFAVFQFSMIFVWIICPLWLQHMQIYKKTFRGPWDIAEG
jgi:phosphatidylinositol glycan class C protein